jgi:hypothetical protein
MEMLRPTCSARTTSLSGRAGQSRRLPYAYVAPSNTGIPSGFDLNNDGKVGGGDDALGFGAFEGQYGMAILSRCPIDRENVRTFPELPVERHARSVAAG